MDRSFDQLLADFIDLGEGPFHSRTPEKFMEQTPSEFMARVRRLEALAHPQTVRETWEYENWMNAAKANGSTYVEALEYAIGMKLGGAH